MLDRTTERRAPQERRPVPRAPLPAVAAIEPDGLTVTALRRRRPVLPLCALLFPLAAWTATEQLTPRYTAVATVMFEPTEHAARGLQSILRDVNTTDAVLASEVEVIGSLSVARRLVRRFDLSGRPEFAWWLRDAVRAGTPWFRLREALAARLAPLLPAVADLVAPRPVARIPPEEPA